MYARKIFTCAVILCVMFFRVSLPAFASTFDHYNPLIRPDSKSPVENQEQKRKPDNKKKRRVQKNDKTKPYKRKSEPKPASIELPRIIKISLTGSSPYALLRKTNSRTISIPFAKYGKGFRIDENTGAIPSGTRFTVPKNYKVYCADGHTKKISGKVYRADYNGQTMLQYDSGSEIEYVADSGMIIIASSLADNPLQPKPDKPTEEIKVDYVKAAKPNYDNRSEKPEDVIATYEISQKHKNDLIRMHNEAAKMLSKEGRAERYEELFKAYRNDYLAAYGVALAEFDMYHGRKCINWCNTALSINPRYLPAKLLRKKAEGII